MKDPRPALLTDLYLLTMAQGYFHARRQGIEAVFEYTLRELPPDTGFALFAGLEDMVRRIETLRFDEEAIRYLRGLRLFRPEFLHALRRFRFSGHVHAVPEGTVVFPREPLVRVRAPLWEGQLLEALVLNSLNFPTLVATKAARVVLAAGGDPVFEFGLRRAQGPDGGLTASRAAFIGGVTGTSNVEAGRRYGIPVAGTHAHSWVMSFPDERTAFQAYLDAFPEGCTLLVDTYDTVRSGLPHAVEVFREARKGGWKGRPAVRIDSGDLAAAAQAARRLFREAGFPDPLIVASNELDEHRIAELKRRGSGINAWGVGTRLVTGGEYPALNGIYKLAALRTGSRWTWKLKVSGEKNKSTDPGVKRVLRYTAEGRPVADLLLLLRESAPSSDDPGRTVRTRAGKRFLLPRGARSRSLLRPLFREGRRVGGLPPLHGIRERAGREKAALPPELLRIHRPRAFPVLLSPGLYELRKRLTRPWRETGAAPPHEAGFQAS